MNFVGELNEYYQKRKLEMPVYQIKTKPDGTFVSGIMLLGGEDTGKTFVSKCAFTKKQSKQMVARQVLDFLAGKKKQIVRKEKTIMYVLIDMENVHYKTFFNDYEFSANIRFVGFVTRSHALAKREHPFKVVKINSDRRDVVDVRLIMYAQEIMLDMGLNIGAVCVVTKDKFGSALVDCINETRLNVRGVGAKSMEEMLDKIK